MNFLLDESADARLATYLRSVGHNVTTVVQDYSRSLLDPDILAIAHQENRILITNDLDFGELVFRHSRPHSGVILFRLTTALIDIKIERLNHVLQHYADRLDQFIVVTLPRVRVRIA